MYSEGEFGLVERLNLKISPLLVGRVIDDFQRISMLGGRQVLVTRKQSLKSTFKQEDNARLWLYSQIMKFYERH